MAKVEFIDSQGLPRAIRPSRIDKVAILALSGCDHCWVSVVGNGFNEIVAEGKSVEEMLPIYREWVEKVWGGGMSQKQPARVRELAADLINRSSYIYHYLMYFHDPEWEGTREEASELLNKLEAHSRAIREKLQEEK